MIRNFVIIAFILSAVTACDSSEKAMEQDKAAETPLEQLNENVQNEAGNMVDAVKDTAGDAVEGSQEMAEDMKDTSIEIKDAAVDGTKEMADGIKDASNKVKDAAVEAYDDSKEATKEVVDDMKKKMDE